MVIDFRQAGPQDAALIALLGRVTFREAFGRHFERHPLDLGEYLDATFSVRKIEASILKSVNRYWLAFVDGLPAGYAKRKYPSPHELIDDRARSSCKRYTSWLNSCLRGVGDVLINAVMKYAANLTTNLWLAVVATNDWALRFYERHGWAAVGRTSFTIGAQSFRFLVLRHEHQ